MPARLVIPRTSEGSVPPATDGARSVARPSLASLRLVFGVGPGPDEAPTDAAFHPAYTVAMPVVSAGGLDPDGVYEFDAGAQLELLAHRATRRRWAVRLELEIVQSAEALNAAELWIRGARADGESLDLRVLGPAEGEALTGGGRRIVIATELAHEPEAARCLGGRFELQLRDAEPEASASVESSALLVDVDLRRYEFEDEGERAP